MSSRPRSDRPEAPRTTKGREAKAAFGDAPESQRWFNEVLAQEARTSDPCELDAYIDAGFPLIPLEGKRPRDAGWMRRVYDGAEMQKRLATGAGNVGVQLTAESLVIDVDPRNDKLRRSADELFEALQRELDIDLAKAPRVRTGRGGLHIYLRKPADVRRGELLPEFGKAIEFKSEGRQMVAAGSIHPETGRRYRWDQHTSARLDFGVLDAASGELVAVTLEDLLVEAPQALLDALSRQEEGGGAEARYERRDWVSDALPERAQQVVEGHAAVRARFEGETDGLDDHSDSGIDMSLASQLVRHGCEGWEIEASLRLSREHRCARKSPEEKGDAYFVRTVNKALRQAEKERRAAGDFDAALTIVLDSAEPSRVAARFAQEHGTIRCWRGDFYRWVGTHWRSLGDGDLEAELRDWLARVEVPTRTGEMRAYQTTRKNVGDVLAALRAACHLGDSLETPFWIDPQDGDPGPADLLPFSNGVLDLRTFELCPADPRLFALHRVDCAYDPTATAPRWDRFLAEIFRSDKESARCVEETLGYCLTDDTSLEKAFLWQGAKRGGKGTILRLLRRMVGPDRYTAPTVSSFGGDFGMQQLIGRSVAAIADARGNDARNPHVVVERILSITGEDAQSINRKHLPFWNGTLPTRLIYVSNVSPKLKDPSGVIVTRFIAVYFRESFLGKEDANLTRELEGELPGIVNRALAGLERLRKRGRFEQPQTGRVLLDKMDEQTGPVRAFVEERCVLGPEHQIECASLYRVFIAWSHEHGHRSMTSATFGADLFALGKDIEKPRPHVDGKRLYTYRGITLARCVSVTGKELSVALDEEIADICGCGEPPRNTFD